MAIKLLVFILVFIFMSTQYVILIILLTSLNDKMHECAPYAVIVIIQVNYLVVCCEAYSWIRVKGPFQ